jgi:signal transduction histidine kinase
MRNALQAATLSFNALRSGRVGINSQTAEVSERSHARLRDMIGRLLTQVRGNAAQGEVRQRFVLRDLVSESMAFVMEEARSKGITIDAAIDELPQVEADRGMLLSAFTNLLQNAIKFSCPAATVSINLRWMRAIG